MSAYDVRPLDFRGATAHGRRGARASEYENVQVDQNGMRAWAGRTQRRQDSAIADHPLPTVFDPRVPSCSRHNSRYSRQIAIVQLSEGFCCARRAPPALRHCRLVTPISSAPPPRAMKSVLLAGRTKSPHLVGLTIGQAPGLGGVEHPHLLTYDPCKVGLYKALWSQNDLTVCNSPWIWGHHSLYIILRIGTHADPRVHVVS